MIKDHEHDQEGSESTSSEYVSAAEDLHSVDRGDRKQRVEAPSMSFFQGSSNVKNINPIFNEVHGDATIIRFGDGQFTDIQRNLICDYIANLTVLPDINDNLKKHILTQSIISLPRAEAVFNDYQTKKKTGPCFEGTRVALLREMADWATGPDESRMYILSGLAGIGKSTVAYTIASRAAELNLLSASFFFSRDEADRKNAKRFFCTIAYQLCVYNETFAKVIGDALLTERGSAATTKVPQEQLNALILDPLRSLVQSLTRPILVVVDALDECDEDDEDAVVMGLSQLVRVLPSFKVILTTRPQPLVNYLFDNHDGHKIFRLQDIEDKIVDGDIRVYLSYSLSQEQARVRLRNPKGEWCASDEDIESLVKAAGRLFIIASTAVLYVLNLNKTLGDPGGRMKKLLSELAQDRTPFHALDHFYSVIARSAFQADDGDDDIVECYQVIVGTITVLQTPLPVVTLACFIGEESEKIYAILRNLQSVILLGSDDVPRIYHKSFPDFLTDQARCKDPRLRIDPRARHTWIATRCLEIMDKQLIFNILGLGDVTRFMSNKDGLKKDGIMDEKLQEKIPADLRYACVYWANHLEAANIEDIDFMNKLEKFADERMLYWLEVLSLIGKLDLAHHAIRVVLKHLKLTGSDLHQLLTDALRFISKFYEVIERSALHTYYSALPFTPSDSLLYRRYSKQAADNNVKICCIEGGPETWGALVANLSHEDSINVKFSLDSTLLASCSEGDEFYGSSGMLKIWDAVTGTPISTISGDRFAVSNDFSTVASSKDNIITYYNTDGSARGTSFTTSSSVQVLALSESNRVAAALSDGTVWLWESRNAESIASFDEFKDKGQLTFSPTGTRLAYSSANGIVKLRDGNSGRFIADLQCGSPNFCFKFSGDGTRIASRSQDHGLTLWNSESGGVIGAAGEITDDTIWLDGCDLLAISANGSLLATGDSSKVTLWSGNNDSLTQIDVLEFIVPRSMAFSLDNILAMGIFSCIELYSVKTHSFSPVLWLPDPELPRTMAVSPDCSRLAVEGNSDTVRLCNIQAIDTSNPPSKEAFQRNEPNALALSRDCSRLACGFSDGTVELWETSPAKRQIASHQGHVKRVSAVGFRPDGAVFASGSYDGTIKLWNGGDGSLCGSFKAPAQFQNFELKLALSNSVLVAAWHSGVSLWSLDTPRLIHTFENYSGAEFTVSIAENSTLIAVAYDHNIFLLDAVNHITIATFDVPDAIHTLTFLPDNSQLVATPYVYDFITIDLINKRTIKEPILKHLTQLPNTPFWHDAPIWYFQNNSALYSQHKSLAPVLYIPKDIPVKAWTQGSSMIAFGCKDGRLILLRLTTSHFG